MVGSSGRYTGIFIVYNITGMHTGNKFLYRVIVAQILLDITPVTSIAS